MKTENWVSKIVLTRFLKEAISFSQKELALWKSMAF